MFSFFIAIAMSLTLSSCALFQPKMEYGLGEWSFKGKMAVRTINKSSNVAEASNFNVDWLQQGDSYTIELSGPLGQGTVKISGQPGNVTLTQGNSVASSHSLTDLIYQQTNLELPLEHIQYWVRALPFPEQSFTSEQNDLGLISIIEQAGWHVSIYDYFDFAEPLPKKLSFAKADDSGKLIIREWIVPTINP